MYRIRKALHWARPQRALQAIQQIILSPVSDYYDASREDCEIWNVMVAAGYAEAGEKDKHGGRMYKMTREGLTWLGKKLGIVIHDMEE